MIDPSFLVRAAGISRIVSVIRDRASDVARWMTGEVLSIMYLLDSRED